MQVFATQVRHTGVCEKKVRAPFALPVSPLYPPHLNVVGMGWVECQAVAKKKSVLAGVRVPVSPDNIELWGGMGGDGKLRRGLAGLFFRKHRTRLLPLCAKVYMFSFLSSVHLLWSSSVPPLWHCACIVPAVVHLWLQSMVPLANRESSRSVNTGWYHCRYSRLIVLAAVCVQLNAFLHFEADTVFDSCVARWHHT